MEGESKEAGVVAGERKRYISGMEMSAPFSSSEYEYEMPMKPLLPPSHFEVFQQCDQTTFLPAHDFQLAYAPAECTRTTFQNLELPKWDSFCSNGNTCISNCLVKPVLQQQQPVLQQQHLEESCVEQEGYCYAGLERANCHQILERITPVKIYGQPTGHDSCYNYKMQCKDQIRDAQWQLIYESFLNDCQGSASCLDLSSAPIMPMLPSGSHFSASSTGLPSRKGKRQEDIIISPRGLTEQKCSVDEHEHEDENENEMMMNSLPEKGKLLEAVVKAGPLLQTLLLAGPLPMWQRPPPDLDSSEIPLVPILPISPLNPPPHQSPTAFTHKSPQEVKYAHKKDPSLIQGQSFPYSPKSSSFKKRFMIMDDPLHNASSPLKHAKLQ